MTDTSALRRHPQQERGQRRIEMILDAAEQVLVELGLEATNTNAIAARAQTSIGSLYQFFPNKEAILQALMLRYQGQMRTLWETLLTPDAASLGLSPWIAQVISAFAAIQEANPGFQTLFCMPAEKPDFPVRDYELHSQISAGVEGIFAVWSPDMPVERRALLAEISIAVVKALLPLIPDVHSARRQAMLDEMKAMLCCYLEPHFGHTNATDLASAT